MTTGNSDLGAFQEILERRAADLNCALRNRDDIAIEKSADQMDEIQYASERQINLLLLLIYPAKHFSWMVSINI